MATYIYTGHKGAGKTLCAVRQAMDYLAAGRRVASNMTLFPEAVLGIKSKAIYQKLPYMPSGEHLFQLGRGDIGGVSYDAPLAQLSEDAYDESRFGLVLLDECGSWLNSRDWSEKGRRELFRWITHARKLGWDVALIVQDFEALDAQIRRSVVEIHVTCSRLDRIALPIPFVRPTLPKAHLATYRYKDPRGMLIERKVSSGRRYFKAYRTREAVTDERELREDGTELDKRAVWTMLSPWHRLGRYDTSQPRTWVYFLAFAVQRLALAAIALVSVLLRGAAPMKDATDSTAARRADPRPARAYPLYNALAEPQAPALRLVVNR